jgi:hypothetical protein
MLADLPGCRIFIGPFADKVFIKKNVLIRVKGMKGFYKATLEKDYQQER